MNSVLGQKEYNGYDNERQQAKDQECSKADQWEKLIYFMLDVGDHFETAELAYFFHGSKHDDNHIISILSEPMDVN